MNRILFKSNIKNLVKVRERLILRQTMDYRQVILCKLNNERTKVAIGHIELAIQTFNSIE